MAEVMAGIGLAAAIAGLISFIKPITKDLGPSSHGKQELNKMIRTLIASKRSYETLREFLEYDDEQESILSEYLDEPEKQCMEVLSILRTRLEHRGFVDKFVLGGKWDKKFDNCVKILENAKELFDLAIQTDQYKTSSTLLKTMKDNIAVSKTYFENITESVDSNTERLAGLAVQTHSRHDQAREWHYEDTEKLDEVINEMNTWKDERLTKEDDILRDEIVRWLCTTNPGINQEAAVKKHEPTTGSWFITSNQYKRWLRETGFIWLQGMAGCGKTILCSSIIKATQQYCKGETQATLTYFYFSYSDVEKQKASNFIRSILGQFVHQKARMPKIPKILKDLYDTYKHSTPPIKSLLSVFNIILQLPGDNFLIIDALDECPVQENGRDELCEHLRYLSSLERLHILATSRKEVDLEDGLTESERLFITPIRNPEVDADIRRYVQSQLATNSRFRAMKWLPKVKDDILKTLESRSQGMFRWAFCQLETIKACRNAKDVSDKLASLPKTLDETYTRILEAITDDDRKVAITALQWLAFSNRPLTVKELSEAAIIYPGQDPAFEIANRFEDPLDILRILSSLVGIQTRHKEVDKSITEKASVHKNDFGDADQIDNDATEPSKEDLVLLAHFSIKEYLVSNRLPPSVKPFATNPHLGHRFLTESCLWYNGYILTLLDRKYDSMKSAEISQYHETSRESETSNLLISDDFSWVPPDGSFPLIGYSQLQWTTHKNNWVLDKDCNNLILKTLCSPSWETLCGMWHAPIAGYSDLDIPESLGCPLFVAVYYDLYDVCSMILAAGADPNPDVRAVWWRPRTTVLEISVTKGNERILKLLIDSGSKVNEGAIENDKRRIPMSLHYAVRQRRIDLVRILIHSGANTGSRRNDSGRLEERKTPLEIAADDQSWDIFRVIFEHGRGVNLNHALRIAADKGNWEVFGDLLGKGASLNGVLDLPVGWALEVIIPTVKALLDYGADVNACGGWAGSVLQKVAATSTFGTTRVALFRLLIEYGADANIQHEDENTCTKTRGKTPLQIILLAGPSYTYGLWQTSDFLEEVEILLDYGAHVHPPGNKNWSSLQRIIKIVPPHAVSVDLILLLLKYGAKVDPDPELPNATEFRHHRLLAELLLRGIRKGAY